MEDQLHGGPSVGRSTKWDQSRSYPIWQLAGCGLKACVWTTRPCGLVPVVLAEGSTPGNPLDPPPLRPGQGATFLSSALCGQVSRHAPTAAAPRPVPAPLPPASVQSPPPITLPPPPAARARHRARRAERRRRDGVHGVEPREDLLRHRALRGVGVTADASHNEAGGKRRARGFRWARSAGADAGESEAEVARLPAVLERASMAEREPSPKVAETLLAPHPGQVYPKRSRRAPQVAIKSSPDPGVAPSADLRPRGDRRWLKLARYWPRLVSFGPTRSDRTRPKAGPIWRNVEQGWPNYGQIWPTLVKPKTPTSCHIWPTLAKCAQPSVG